MPGGRKLVRFKWVGSGAIAGRAGLVLENMEETEGEKYRSRQFLTPPWKIKFLCQMGMSLLIVVSDIGK